MFAADPVRASPQAPTAPAFDSNRAWEHLRQLVAIGPRPAGSAAIEQIAHVHQGAALGNRASPSPNRRGTIRRQRAGFTWSISSRPFRRSARTVSSSPATTIRSGFAISIRRRERRRLERRVSDRAGTRAQGAPERARRSSCCFSTARKRSSSGQGTDHTYGSRHYVAEAKRTGSLASLKAFVLVDMIGDRDLQIKRDLNSTTWLTDIIWAAAQKQQFGHPSGPSGRRSKTIICRSSRPACHRSTSSISNIPPGTPRPIHSTPLARAVCRLLATRSWRRCRRSKRDCRSRLHAPGFRRGLGFVA